MPKKEKNYLEARRRATSRFTSDVRKLPEFSRAAEEMDEANMVANLMFEARQKAGLTQAEVAREMGIGQSAFSRMERGNATMKNFLKCLRICGYTLKLVPDRSVALV